MSKERISKINYAQAEIDYLKSTIESLKAEKKLTDDDKKMILADIIEAVKIMEPEILTLDRDAVYNKKEERPSQKCKDLAMSLSRIMKAHNPNGFPLEQLKAGLENSTAQADVIKKTSETAQTPVETAAPEKLKPVEKIPEYFATIRLGKISVEQFENITQHMWNSGKNYEILKEDLTAIEQEFEGMVAKKEAVLQQKNALVREVEELTRQKEALQADITGYSRVAAEKRSMEKSIKASKDKLNEIDEEYASKLASLGKLQKAGSIDVVFEDALNLRDENIRLKEELRKSESEKAEIIDAFENKTEEYNSLISECENLRVQLATMQRDKSEEYYKAVIKEKDKEIARLSAIFQSETQEPLQEMPKQEEPKQKELPEEDPLEKCINWFTESGRKVEMNTSNIPYTFRLFSKSNIWFYVIYYDTLPEKEALIAQWDRVYDAYENIHIIAKDPELANQIAVHFNKWVTNIINDNNRIMSTLLDVTTVKQWGKSVKINCTGIYSRFKGTRKPKFDDEAAVTKTI